MAPNVIRTVASIPIKNEFDLLDVSKSIIKILGPELPGLRAWIAAWNRHDQLELNRRVERFWQAFVLEAQHSDSRFGRLQRDIRAVENELDIIGRVVQNVRAEFSENKRRLYARVAVNAILVPEAEMSHEQKLSIIDALDRLTDEDLKVLKYFGDGQTRQLAEVLSGTVDDESELGTLIVCIRKLEARGLINRTSAKGVNTESAAAGTSDHWKNYWKFGSYELLPFGRSLLFVIEGIREVR